MEPLKGVELAMVLNLFILSKNPPSMSNSLPLDPAEFTSQFDLAARQAGFKPERFGEVSGHPLLAYTKRTPGPRPAIRW